MIDGVIERDVYVVLLDIFPGGFLISRLPR